MKKIFCALMFFCTVIAEGFGQAIIADPAVNVMNTTAANAIPIDPFLIKIDRVILLKVPVINYNLNNALPSGSCKIKIGLGSRLELDPTFNLSTISTSNYFNWTAETIGGQIQITGDLISALPRNFLDTIIFQVRGKLLGSSTVTTNFLVTNHNTTVNLSDENGANNNTALAYTIIENDGGPLPVTFTKIASLKENCSIRVNFSTANEVNVNRFEIEVSTDGVRYNKIGALAAGSFGNYTFKFDITPNLMSPNLFTRIKSVDFDDQFQYSEVSKVNGLCAKDKNSIIIFPNPAPQNISYLTIRNAEGTFKGNYMVLISDINGKLVSKKKVMLFNERQFNYQHGILPAGDYFVQVFSDKGERIYSSKWQKQ